MNEAIREFVDSEVAFKTASLQAKVTELTKEIVTLNATISALRSERDDTQAKIRALLPVGKIDFRGLMQKIQAATNAGKLANDQVSSALAGVGLKPEEMAQLIGNASLIARVDEAIDKILIAPPVAPAPIAPPPPLLIPPAPVPLPDPPGVLRCKYCNTPFKAKPQQIRHALLGNNVYCGPHKYGANRVENPST
jgi:hypothetical protein